MIIKKQIHYRTHYGIKKSRVNSVQEIHALFSVHKMCFFFVSDGEIWPGHVCNRFCINHSSVYTHTFVT